MLSENVLQAYQDGSDVAYIIECFNITHEEFKKILLDYKEGNRHKRTFTKEFRQMVAERDINGVSRRQIASELEINFTTIKRACEEFGQAVKDKATSDQAYTIVEGVKGLEVCPSCQSKSVNEINSIADNVNTTGIYCKNCGDEHFTIGNDVYRVNFEYLEE